MNIRTYNLFEYGSYGSRAFQQKNLTLSGLRVLLGRMMLFEEGRRADMGGLVHR